MAGIALDIKKKFSVRSDRVKSVDIHPTEPWIIASLYNGSMYIYNYQNQSVVKQFEVTDQPVRCVKFIARKQWIIAASDDYNIRVYNYNTMECIKKWDAHADYIRSIAIHPTQPYVLTCSDDMSIKLWNWERDWSLMRVFEGHTHYVMMVTFNPKDLNTFASASLDKSVKVWSLGSKDPNFTLEGHEKGVNCVDYFPGGDKPYLVTGSDDFNVKIWDYQTKACVATLEGHTHNVSCALFHPELPIIISGSEDNTVRLWNSNTYKLEKPLSYGWERVWALGVVRGANSLVIGFDDGTILLKLGREVPVASMDSAGRIIFAKHNQLLGGNVKPSLDQGVADGERLTIATKELGTCEFYPRTLKHNWNGRFIVAQGDSDFVISTALEARHKSFGNALEFAWARAGGQYAVRESTTRIKVFDNFEATKTFRPDFNAEGLFGGELIGVKSNSFICLYDWKDARLIRKIEVAPKSVFWNEAGDQLVIATDTSFYILKYSRETVQAVLESGNPIPDDGIEEAFDVLHEIPERIRTACWVGDCFLYTTAQNVIKYCVGAKTDNIAHLDRTMYLLGYLPRFGRIFLVDKSHNVVSYTLRLAVINYQTAILRGDMKTANELLPQIPESEKVKIAHFLDAQGLKEMALEITTDMDHKFELAVQLGKLEMAYEIAKKSDSEHKWKLIADMAMNELNFELAEQCMWQASDLNGLLLLYSSYGDADGYSKLAAKAQEKGKYNVAFLCLFLLGRLDDCIGLLCLAKRLPEAAFLARTYAPSRVPDVIALWKQELSKTNPRLAESIADPSKYPNLFPDLSYGLKAEQWTQKNKFSDLPAGKFPEAIAWMSKNLVLELKQAEQHSANGAAQTPDQ